jgi:hypothetical protein
VEPARSVLLGLFLLYVILFLHPQVNIDDKESIKRLSKEEGKRKKAVVITKCLQDNCTGWYTDTISESLIIQCRDARHQQKVERPLPSQPPTTQPVLGTTQRDDSNNNTRYTKVIVSQDEIIQRQK